MIIFIQYLKDYFRKISIFRFVINSLFVGSLIWLNYQYGIETHLISIHPWFLSLFLLYLLYLIVYLTSWLITSNWRSDNQIGSGKKRFGLAMLAPFVFAVKMIRWDFLKTWLEGFGYPWQSYWFIILEWPLKLVLILMVVWMIRKKIGVFKNSSMFSLSGFSFGKYLPLLLIMIPLVSIAATRPDFLQSYPRAKNIAFVNAYSSNAFPWTFLFEFSYGLDFFSIEVFFRGLLVLIFSQLLGIGTILPMASFYCCVHFGKPAGECISSYFGGLVLGVIARRTNSLSGGLFLHLCVAYMMELGGVFGHLYLFR